MNSKTTVPTLTIIGTGIQVGTHITREARYLLEHTKRVFFLVADPATFVWVQRINPEAESLHIHYAESKDRLISYHEMVERILNVLRSNEDVCVAFYGHPGVFVLPSHEAIHRAKLEGYQARMLPAISAEDCLFADLGIDPGEKGCQSYEATSFLVFHPAFDTSVPLILWQISVIGELGYNPSSPVNIDGLSVLVDELKKHYQEDHEVVIYVASEYPVCDSIITKTPLKSLPQVCTSPVATLYVPPLAPPSIDRKMVERLGMLETLQRRHQGGPDLGSRGILVDELHRP